MDERRFPETITLAGVEAFVLIDGVEGVAQALAEAGEVGMALRLEDAVAILREKLIGGSDLPPVG